MSHLATGAGVFAVTAIIFYWAAIARLKRQDPAQFQALGSPEPLHDDTKGSSWIFFEYMIRCRFLRQGDIALATIGTLWYLSIVLAIALFIWEMV